MDFILSSFYAWFVGGLTSGVFLTKIIELVWSRWTRTFDNVREKKDAIGQEFKKIYLEGKKHNFSEPPRDQDHFRMVILDIEKYDMKLSNKLAQCRSKWVLNSMRGDEGLVQIAGLSRNDFEQFNEWRREAENLADEVYEEIKKKWII